MKCFEVVRSVLDEIYEQIPGTQASRNATIVNSQNYFRTRYRSLLNANDPIDYADPVNRFAYIYTYVTNHANLVAQRIAGCAQLRALFLRDRVAVSCIGGGPGSDFLGILKYMMEAQSSAQVRCFLIDRERAWGESWSDVDDKLDPQFRISTTFQDFDVLDANTWADFNKYKRVDLITMTYFMSELYTQRTRANAFFENLFQDLPQGAAVLYIDNNAQVFTDWFDRLANENGLAVIDEGQVNARMPFDEQKTDLGRHYTLFGEPKLTAQIAYRICQKG